MHNAVLVFRPFVTWYCIETAELVDILSMGFIVIDFSELISLSQYKIQTWSSQMEAFWTKILFY